MLSPEQVSACLDYLEAAYAWQRDDDAWMMGVLEATVRVWGDPRWAAAYCYDASAADRVQFGKPVIWRSTPAVEALLGDGLTRHGRDPEIARLFRTLSVGFGCLAGGVDEAGRKVLVGSGAVEYFAINGMDASGLGCFMGIAADRTSLTPEELVVFNRITVHLASAYRCRRRMREARASALVGAEAVLDHDGRVLDARGAAEPREARRCLQDGARAMQKARGRQSSANPTSQWRPRVAGRWTLLDVSDAGTPAIAARENQTSLPGLDVLTDREQQVVASAVAGRTTKEIAYELGISHATARVLLARAYGRLRVRSRRELFALPTIRVLRGEPISG
jgi:DNA-binding CsgD family transcriptional regulator